ncbi:MAG: hypothetical protein U5Q44_06390 [Dehalococcoidia bacterium]|nr:hypothetical protein [Dehalococcoidia bacterium]
MERRPGNAGGQGGMRATGTAIALNWRYMAPVAVLVAVLAFAFALQPGPSQGSTGASSMTTPEGGEASSELAELPTATPTEPLPTSTPEPAQPTASDAEDGGTNGAPNGDPGQPGSAESETPGNEVASARSTPSDAEDGGDGGGANDDGAGAELISDSEQCGRIQESNHPVGVEQKLGDISVRATNVAVYPTDYLRCILRGTGGEAAMALAHAVGDAAREGATHAVLIDLWIANSGPEFGQVNLQDAVVIAGGTNTGRSACSTAAANRWSRADNRGA